MCFIKYVIQVCYSKNYKLDMYFLSICSIHIIYIILISLELYTVIRLIHIIFYYRRLADSLRMHKKKVRTSMDIHDYIYLFIKILLVFLYFVHFFFIILFSVEIAFSILQICLVFMFN